MGHLRSAFMADEVSTREVGLDITAAFAEGKLCPRLPQFCTFVIVGEYQFEPGDELTDHIFDARIHKPDGTPVARLQTVATEMKAHALVRDSRGNPENFTGTMIVLRVGFEAQEFGRHQVTLTLDGEPLTAMGYDVVEYPGGGFVPDDARGIQLG